MNNVEDHVVMNGLLSDIPLFTISERAKYLSKCYEDKVKRKGLKFWSDAELHELGLHPKCSELRT